MSRQEADKKGTRTEFYWEKAVRAVKKVAEECGSEFFREIGRKGDQSRGRKFGNCS